LDGSAMVDCCAASTVHARNYDHSIPLPTKALAAYFAPGS
jgi:hypothetical protein